MSQGQIVEQGTHNELMALGKEYYQLVTAQVKTNENVDASKKDGIVATIEKDEDEDLRTHETKTVIIHFYFFGYRKQIFAFKY